MIAAIDIGATTTNVVLRVNDTLFTRGLASATASTIAEQILTSLAIDAGIAPATIDRIAATGVGSRRLPATLIGRPISRIDEFDAIGAGGTRLAGVSRALVISIGTGTAIVTADGDRYEHFGGTGVGGGTIVGLGRRLCEVPGFDEIDALARDGDLSRVDLRIGDLVGGSLDNLGPDATASNFGKPQAVSAPADLALALFNMVAESVGVLGLAAARATNHDTIVIVGRLLGNETFRARMARFNGAHGRAFLLPHNAESAVAIGALELANRRLTSPTADS